MPMGVWQLYITGAPCGDTRSAAGTAHCRTPALCSQVCRACSEGRMHQPKWATDEE